MQNTRVYSLILEFKLLNNVIRMGTELTTVKFPQKITANNENWNEENECPKDRTAECLQT